jgi:hypothetical protein
MKNLNQLSIAAQTGTNVKIFELLEPVEKPALVPQKCEPPETSFDGVRIGSILIGAVR